MAYHVYVSNSGSEYFSRFLMDEETGGLEARPNIELDSTPGAAATNADGSRLYVSLRSSKRFGSYAVDRASGALAQVNAVALHDGSPYVYTDNTDRFLLASYYGSGYVTVHGIGDDGALSEVPLQKIQTEGHAHSIQTDRSNRFAFVPHTNPANAIYQFRFDEQTGMLTPNDPAKMQPATPEGPRHFAFHPARELLYSVNENGCTVTAHTFDPGRGTLEPFQVIGTLPEGIGGEEHTTAEIRITHDGRHLYASNRGHESIALFDIAPDGGLTAKGHVATEPTPRFFDLDPSGRFLYSAGQTSGRMAAYRIEADSGALEPLAVYEVGDGPLWITFVKQQV